MNSQRVKPNSLYLFAGLLAAFLAVEFGIALILDQMPGTPRSHWLETLLNAGLIFILCIVWRNSMPQAASDSAVQESEERYRALFDFGGDAVVFFKTMSDGSRQVIDANEMACQRLGYSRNELVGMDVAAFCVQGYPGNREGAENQPKQFDHPLFEAVHLTRDGRQIPVEVHARTFQFRGESVTLAIARDISGRCEAERDKEDLRRNMQALLNAIQESSLLLDKQGKVLVINEVAAKRFNATPAEMVGKNVYELLPSEVAKSRMQRFDLIAQRGLPEVFEDEREGRLFSSSIYPVRDTAGEISGFAIYAADITQRHRLQGVEMLFSEINQLVLQGVPLHTVLIVACKKVTDLFGLSVAWVGRKEQDGAVTVLAGGGDASRYVDQLKLDGVRWDDALRGGNPAGSAIRTGRAQVVADPHFDLCAASEHGLQSVLAIPLVIRSEIHGVFALYSTSPAFFAAAAVVDMMTGVAMRISVAMETAMDQQQIRLLSSALAAAGNGVMITNARGKIQWVNPAFMRLSGYGREELIGQTPRILKSGVQSQAYYQSLWETIARGDTWNSETTERARDGSLYDVSQTITPMRNEEGEITHYIAIHEDVTAQKLSQARIAHMAHYDALTGLPNRSLFFDRLKQAFSVARRTQAGLTLMFLDLDGFKQVNDSMGHHVGDLLLRAVAQRLRDCVRESDTVSRLGGDEFTVILNDTHDRGSVCKVADKIIESIGLPFEFEGDAVNIGVSIGIAIHSGEAVSEDELVNSADQAMYAAKSSGKNVWRLSEQFVGDQAGFS